MFLFVLKLINVWRSSCLKSFIQFLKRERESALSLTLSFIKGKLSSLYYQYLDVTVCFRRGLGLKSFDKFYNKSCCLEIQLKKSVVYFQVRCSSQTYRSMKYCLTKSVIDFVMSLGASRIPSLRSCIDARRRSTFQSKKSLGV